MEANGYTKEQIRNAKAAPAHEISITAAIIAKQLLDGMPDYNPKQNEYWESRQAQWAVYILQLIF